MEVKKESKSMFAFCVSFLLALGSACDTNSESSSPSEPLIEKGQPVPEKKRFSQEELIQALESFDTISSVGTEYHKEVAEKGMLPRGSALLTSSGNLKAAGITAIIHAAPGSMFNSTSLFRPSLEGVRLSVKNSLILAKKHGHHRVAIPFIGGAIFSSQIGVPDSDLAETIIRATLESRDGLEIRFITFSDKDTKIFQSGLKKLLLEKDFQGVSAADAEVNQGNITQFKVHHASAIVNAANMEVQFGSGVSGAIAEGTGHRDEINQEAKKAIEAFNQTVLEFLD